MYTNTCKVTSQRVRVRCCMSPPIVTMTCGPIEAIATSQSHTGGSLMRYAAMRLRVFAIPIPGKEIKTKLKGMAMEHMENS